MSKCENCGCKVYKYGCVNCNEESYIYFDQMVELKMKPSSDFFEKVEEQQAKHEALGEK